ncbi:hypothetical protein Tdes44962_MAKER08091 [Teratosphaeria destructans]|uniref:Uncharacterized protein n=1 Tax=Teratosphaeria destructans TaxID=418781 RepID=A0A9W7SXV7_9PEZI|nr:hypothetical protein Tdes44962_MAKER08091 [Teratosphaeria destructans]
MVRTPRLLRDLDRQFDRLLYSWMALPPLTQKLVVIAVGLLSTTTGYLLGRLLLSMMRAAPYVLLRLLPRSSPTTLHHPQPPEPTYRIPWPVHNHTHLPSTPNSLTPFLDRLASSLSSQLLPWSQDLPVSPPDPTSIRASHPAYRIRLLGEHLALTRQRIGLRSPTGIREWHLDYERRVRNADARNRDLWEQAVRLLGLMAYCGDDVEARVILEGVSGAVQRPGWADCAVWRVQRALGRVEGGLAGFAFEDVGKGVEEVCGVFSGLTEEITTGPWDPFHAEFEAVEAEAQETQREIAAHIARIADQEAAHALVSLALPAMASCRELHPRKPSFPWTAAAFPDPYAACLSHALTYNSSPGVYIPLSWSSPPPTNMTLPIPTTHTSTRFVPGDRGDFGTGVRLYKRSRATLFSNPIPDSEATLEELDFLFQEYLTALLTEMVVGAAGAGWEGVEAVCSQRRTTTWLDEAEEERFSVKGLMRKSFHFLSRLPEPFAGPPRPHTTDSNVGASEEDEEDEIDEDEIEPYDPHGAHLSTHLDPGEEEEEITAAQLDDWILRALKEEDLNLSAYSETERDFLRRAFVGVQGGVWGFWDAGMEGHWIMTWVEDEDEEGGQRGKEGGRRGKKMPGVPLDMGRSVGVLKRGWCGRRGRGGVGGE